MSKVAIVVQRCHETIVGGSENLAWEYATLLRDSFDVDILTSTAVDYSTWANKLRAGIEERDGISIHRFPVTRGRTVYWHELHSRFLTAYAGRAVAGLQPRTDDWRVTNGAWRISQEEEFIRNQGPYCDCLYKYLEDHGDQYSTILFITYLYPTTYFGLNCRPAQQCVLVPTLHDEPTAYMRAFRTMARRTRQILYLTDAEQRLARSLWGELPGKVVGMPVKSELHSPPASPTPYLLYSGRIDTSKRCDELVDYFIRWKKSQPGNLQLVLTGQDVMGVPKRPDIVYRGFVEDSEKFALMAGASAFVMPSPWESFSIATLESMAQRTPVLVNGACEVLADHVTKSGGGHAYRDYDSFSTALRGLLTNDEVRRTQGEAARDYVVSQYDKEWVRDALLQVVDEGRPTRLKVVSSESDDSNRSIRSTPDHWLKSCLCTQNQFESAMFQEWVEVLRPAWDKSMSMTPPPLHRKIWEWCYIAQTLRERGMLQPGRRGLGFGVGKEPLAALFASYGCEIVATDMDVDEAKAAGWVDTNQHAALLHNLNEDRLCPPAEFEQRVSYQVVNMNEIPDNLRGFDFTWSACSFEHLGSIRHGMNFITSMMDCLNPGGIGVHTTEYNVSSDFRTIDEQPVVLFRKRDIEQLARRLRTNDHHLDLDFDTGSGVADLHIDIPPYKHNPHLKLQYLDYVTTSIGLIVEKSLAAAENRCIQRAG